ADRTGRVGRVVVSAVVGRDCLRWWHHPGEDPDLLRPILAWQFAGTGCFHGANTANDLAETLSRLEARRHAPASELGHVDRWQQRPRYIERFVNQVLPKGCAKVP